MNKDDYRSLFTIYGEYIKLGKVCDECNIKRPRLSAFMHGNDYALSIEKLDYILCSIKEICRIIYVGND